MIPLLYAGAALIGIIGGIAVVACWDEIRDWLKDFIPKLNAMWAEVREYVPHGARMYGDLISKGAEMVCHIIHKLYYQEDNQWYEKSTTREVNESQVPASIRNKIAAQTQEADITEEIEQELQLEVG